MMSNDEFGAYWRLCCYSWEEGSIPADLDDLARMLPRTTKKQMEKIWKTIGRCFKPHPTEKDRLVQPRLELERERQAEHRRKQAQNGKKGGRPQKPAGNPSESQEKAVGSFGLPESEPKKSLSSSSSSSIAANAASPTATQGPKLPLLDEQTLAAKAILSAIWPQVAISLTGAMTKTEWGKRNIRYARDLVAAGASLEKVLAAHTAASRRLGEPVKMLNVVQDEIARKRPSPYTGLHIVGAES